MKDINNIKKLISRNEYFYKKGEITRSEYSSNCLLFARKIDAVLDNNGIEVIKDFLLDEFSLPKFRLSISIIKAVPN